MAEVRAAVPADAQQVAAVHVRAWRAAYRGLLAQEYLDGLTADAMAGRYTFGRVGLRLPLTVVAIERAAVRGFATTGLCRDPEFPNHGELLAIYVDPDHVGAGIGRLLMTAARVRLRRLGLSAALLWVLDDNAPAQRFYESDGWRPDGTAREQAYGGRAVRQLRYRCEPL